MREDRSPPGFGDPGRAPAHLQGRGWCPAVEADKGCGVEQAPRPRLVHALHPGSLAGIQRPLPGDGKRGPIG